MPIKYIFQIKRFSYNVAVKLSGVLRSKAFTEDDGGKMFKLYFLCQSEVTKIVNYQSMLTFTSFRFIT